MKENEFWLNNTRL